MKTSNSTIRTTVMRRIHTIHALRMSASGVGASFLILAVSLYFIGREVWVAQVFQNMPQLGHVAAVARFFASAFASTDMIVQTLILLSGVALVWMLREGGRIVFIRPTQFA